MSEENQLLKEVELRVALFERRHTQLKNSLQEALEENKRLSEESNRQLNQIKALEQQLSVASMASGHSPESEGALNSLRSELDLIIKTIDECITLLEKRI